MRLTRILISVLILLGAGSVQSRMITPEDSMHRLMDGEKVSAVEKSPDVQASLAERWNTFKKKAVTKATEIWNKWVAPEGTQVAEKPSLPERDADGLTRQERKLVVEKEETLPEVTAAVEKAKSQQVIDRTEQELRSKEALVVSEPARQPSSPDLRNTKAGVPVFDLLKKKKKKLKSGKTRVVKVRVKSVPRLDIGRPESITKSDFIPAELQNILKAPGQAKALPTPKHLAKKDLDKWTKKKIQLVKQWRGPKESEFGLGKVVTQTKVDKVNVEMKAEKVMAELREMHKISKKDMKMLMALILFERGDKCHVATGLFHDLSKTGKYQEESNFYIGVCSHKMGFHSEAVDRLLKVVKNENPEFMGTAVTNLIENLPQEYIQKVTRSLKAVKNKSLIAEKDWDQIHYIYAKAAHEKGRYSEAVKFSKKVKEESELYSKAQYLYGIGLYGQGKKRKAEVALEDLRKWMRTKNKVDKNLEALIAVNLGRLKFKQERWEAAHQDYLRIPKDHPLWVDALVEQGWAQLNQGDPAGAIGNMYSLHSPYFRSVYMPDSWVVRTIGYLNICQYGDAYRTLTKLEKMHSGFSGKISGYVKRTKSNRKYYSTVKNYIQGSSSQGVDGLPAQVIREVARKKSFLNIQNTINEKVDESSQYDFIEGLLKKDIRSLKRRKATALARRNQNRVNLAKIKTDKTLKPKEAGWRAAVRADNALMRRLAFEIYVHNSAKRGYRNLKSLAKKRLNRERRNLRNLAGREIKKHLKDMKKQIAKILEGNEFLRFEIFAGSGEDIRYQSAGGRTVAGQRIPANVKPQKILNWEFDGEYWEDEIGNYRSTLQNNCPDRARSVVGR